MTKTLRITLGLVLVCLAGMLPSCGERTDKAANKAQDRPNFIIILADDLGYGDIGCYWHQNDREGYEKIETPNIDRMAEEGIRLTSYYAGGSVCTPSRAALLTGCYPPRVGLSKMDVEGDSVIKRESLIGLNPDETTIAEMLRGEGYATACIGKWHLGREEMFHPMRHGFDFHFGPKVRRPGTGTEMFRKRVSVGLVQTEDLTRRYTEEAIEFIRRNKDGPFFLYLAHTMPHGPLAVSEEFRGKSKRGLYGDVVMCLDWYVGKLLEALADLGIDNNTLVVFTSDNGPDPDHGGIAFPLKGGKAWLSEGAYRVPCVVRYPGKIAPGTASDDITVAMDLLPTLAGLAGAELPEQKIDGVDIWRVLKRGGRSPRNSYFYYRTNDLLAVRQGRWKLYFFQGNEVPSSEGRRPRRLYDLVNDPRERVNMLDQRSGVVRGMLELVDAMRRDLGDDHTGVEGSGRRPPGVAALEDGENP